MSTRVSHAGNVESSRRQVYRGAVALGVMSPKVISRQRRTSGRDRQRKESTRRAVDSGVLDYSARESPTPCPDHSRTRSFMVLQFLAEFHDLAIVADRVLNCGERRNDF